MQRPRTPTRISDSLHQRLNSYALAATAAGVSLLALAQSAEAKIIYRNMHHVIGRNYHYVIDLNHDGIGDFTISNGYGCADWCASWLSVIPAKGNTAAGNKFHYALALSGGAVIGLKQFAFSGQKMLQVGGETFPLGYWYNVTNHYLGLKFKIKAKTHYGWARLNVEENGSSVIATLTGYAYETVPNKPIIAGRIKGPDVTTLDDPSLGHLARGASAIPAWRTAGGSK